MQPSDKVLILSEIFPPLVSGPSVVLWRLIKYFPKGSLCVLTARARIGDVYVDPALQLDVASFTCSAPSPKRKNLDTLSIILEMLWIPVIILKGLVIVYRNGIGHILGISGRGNFFIAAYLLSWLSGRPLSVYLFDLYEEGAVSRIRRFMARLFEERILKAASNVFVMSENMQAHYREKYGLKTDYIPHPVVLEPQNNGQWKSGDNCKRIVFTGAVYGAQLDSILNLVRAVNSLEDVKFLVYTTNSPETLKKMGISGQNVEFGFAMRDKIAEIQQNADILFLPLAFNSPYPEVIRTASPSKLPEYLAAGRPILVHAPPDAYIAEYARRAGWGMVVDVSDPEALRTALLRLLSDQALQAHLMEAARAAAKEHDARWVSALLQSHLLSTGSCHQP